MILVHQDGGGSRRFCLRQCDSRRGAKGIADGYLFQLLPGTDFDAPPLQRFQEEPDDFDAAVAVDFHMGDRGGLLDVDDNLVGGFLAKGAEKKATVVSPTRKRGIG